MHRLIAFAGFAALFAAAGSPSAMAHAHLATAIPGDGSTVTSPPTEVDCLFTEALEPRFSTLEVQDSAGKRVDAGNMHLDPSDAKRMVVGVPRLGAGLYTVIWHATSVDTHRTEGRFSFTVAP